MRYPPPAGEPAAAMNRTLFLAAIGAFVLQSYAVYSADENDERSNWKKEIADSRVAVFHTSNGGRLWTDVSPPGLASVAKTVEAKLRDQAVALCALDAQRAWVAVAVNNEVLLQYTADGGATWSETIAPIAADGVRISFLNEREGWLLAMAAPSAGQMEKLVYHTDDSGAHWTPVNSPPQEGRSYYPTGISFRSPKEGWITGQYHGAPDAPLFRTVDGGRSWHVQTLPFPKDFQGGYADTYPPSFDRANPSSGRMRVHLVRHTPLPECEAWIEYITDDGGVTWHPSAYDQHKS
jgi:hypothetical protein